MKFFRFLILISSMILCYVPCFAQYEEYYKVDANTYITTAPNAELYEFPLRRSNYVDIKMPHLKPYRDFIDVEGCKIKKVKRPTSLKVVRFANTQKTPGFNAYVVEYKDNAWIISSVHVKDNTLLNERNAKIKKAKADLDAETQKLDDMYQALNQEKSKLDEEIKGVIEKNRKEYTDSLNYYKSLQARLPKILDSLRTAKMTEEQAKADKAYKDWYNSLSASAKKAASVLSITEAGLAEPNSVGGCDYTLCYINKSKKTIKYFHWTGTVYNRVGDPAYCEIRRTATYKGIDTGPYAYDEEGGGSWDCVVYNYAAATLKLSNIRVDYMDGTSVAIAAADIQKLMEEPSTEVYVSTYDVEKSFMSEWDCRNKIEYWQGQINKLKNSQSALQSSNPRYGEIKSQLYDTSVKIKALRGKIDVVDKFINFR